MRGLDRAPSARWSAIRRLQLVRIDKLIKGRRRDALPDALLCSRGLCVVAPECFVAHNAELAVGASVLVAPERNGGSSGGVTTRRAGQRAAARGSENDVVASTAVAFRELSLGRNDVASNMPTTQFSCWLWASAAVPEQFVAVDENTYAVLIEERESSAHASAAPTATDALFQLLYCRGGPNFFVPMPFALGAPAAEMTLTPVTPSAVRDEVLVGGLESSGIAETLPWRYAGRLFTIGTCFAGIALGGTSIALRVVRAAGRRGDAPSESPAAADENSGAAWVIDRHTQVRVCPDESDVDAARNIFDVRYSGATLAFVAGLEKQKCEIADMMQVALLGSGGSHVDARLGRPRGVLLHGPPGTGKTVLAVAMARSAGVAVECVSGPEILGGPPGEAERTLLATFQRALARAPCVVVLDDVDVMARQRWLHVDDRRGQRLIGLLIRAIDSLGADRPTDQPEQSNDRNNGSVAGEAPTEPRGVFLIGTTNQLQSIDPALRRPGRFDRELELGALGARERAELLQRLAGERYRGRMSVLRNVAAAAHGFVGADVEALWRRACALAVAAASDRVAATEIPSVGEDQLERALAASRPSALREMLAQVPRVHWDDIGGQAEAKRALMDAVELPRRFPRLFAELGMRPPRGVLLYGPPGCSKTLLARAMATDSAANFFHVKGPELYSKYVGDSEKAVRRLFRRAREASPAIIFFDELDALATQRSSDGATGGSSAASAEERVLAQLLTEMDGAETLTDVIVVGATNRPDLLDAALLRPGRFDQLVYVGLPDRDERAAIAGIHLRDVPLDVPTTDAAHWIAGCTDGFSGSEVAALVRESCLIAMAEDPEHAHAVSLRHLEQARARLQPQTSAAVLEMYARFRAGAPT